MSKVINRFDDVPTMFTDAPSWELMLDQLSVKNMVKLVMNGMYATAALSSVGKPATVDFDGLAGISSYMTNLSSHLEKRPTVGYP